MRFSRLHVLLIFTIGGTASAQTPKLDQARRVLGVSARAGEKEVRAAFVKIALAYHEDKKPENPAEAEELLKEASAARDELVRYFKSNARPSGTAAVQPNFSPEVERFAKDFGLGHLLFFGDDTQVKALMVYQAEIAAFMASGRYARLLQDDRAWSDSNRRSVFLQTLIHQKQGLDWQNFVLALQKSEDESVLEALSGFYYRYGLDPVRHLPLFRHFIERNAYLDTVDSWNRTSGAYGELLKHLSVPQIREYIELSVRQHPTYADRVARYLQNERLTHVYPELWQAAIRAAGDGYHALTVLGAFLKSGASSTDPQVLHLFNRIDPAELDHLIIHGVFLTRNADAIQEAFLLRDPERMIPYHLQYSQPWTVNPNLAQIKNRLYDIAFHAQAYATVAERAAYIRSRISPEAAEIVLLASLQSCNSAFKRLGSASASRP